MRNTSRTQWGDLETKSRKNQGQQGERCGTYDKQRDHFGYFSYPQERTHVRVFPVRKTQQNTNKDNMDNNNTNHDTRINSRRHVHALPFSPRSVSPAKHGIFERVSNTNAFPVNRTAALSLPRPHFVPLNPRPNKKSTPYFQKLLRLEGDATPAPAPPAADPPRPPGVFGLTGTERRWSFTTFRRSSAILELPLL